jgi:flavin-dependent dehydrogenase
MQRTLDVCVVGGGVAGAATALQLARRGMRVALIDRAAPVRDHTTARRRTCPAGSGPAALTAGQVPQLHPTEPQLRFTEIVHSASRGGSHTAEILPPAAVHALAALGADGVRTLGSTCRGVLSRWHGDAPGFTDYELVGCTPGRAVNRGAVARCLTAHAVHAGAEVLTIGGTRAERSAAGWSVFADRHRQHQPISCRHLIDATGRSGGFAAALPARCHHDRAVCLSTRHGTPLHDPALLLVDRSTHGWWYAIAAGEDTTEVAFVTDADLLPSARDREPWLAGEYREATLIKTNLEDDPRFATLASRDARSGHRAAAAGDGWLAVGDAALSWDPLSGHGMQFALESAEHAAEAIVAGDAERHYPAYIQWCGDAVIAYDRARASMYGAAAITDPDSAFWRRRREPARDRQPAFAAARLVT